MFLKSGHGQVLYSCKMKVILCPDKKGQGPQLCPAAITEGARCPTQLALRLSIQGGVQVPQTATQTDFYSCSLTETGIGESSLFSQGLGQGYWVVLVRNLMPLRDTSPSLFSGPNRSPAGPRPGELEGLWEKGGILLFL